MPINFLKRKNTPPPEPDDAWVGRVDEAVGGPALPAAGRGRANSATTPSVGAEPAPASAEAPVAAAPAAKAAPTGTVRFDGLTEEWRLVGTMHIDERLSDALNRRETIAISEVSWSPIDGSEGFSPAPGLKSIDPYDLIAVLAGPDTLPSFSEAEKAARRVRKDRYDVSMEAPPFQIRGQVHLHPGESPDRIVEQVTDMFIPLTDAVAYLRDEPVADPDIRVVLVNRLYIRGVTPTPH